MPQRFCRCSIATTDSRTFDSFRRALAFVRTTAPTKPSRLPSVFDLPVSARERRTLLIAALIAFSALVVGFVVLPFARRWSDRETLIAAEVDRLARLRGLVANR